jgi:hypothetical protein
MCVLYHKPSILNVRGVGMARRHVFARTEQGRADGPLFRLQQQRRQGKTEKKSTPMTKYLVF